MGITLDQGRGALFAAVGVQAVAKGGEVGAQLIGVVARGMSTDTQLTSEPVSCWEACSIVAGSGLLPVAFCSGSQARPDAWAMNAS